MHRSSFQSTVALIFLSSTFSELAAHREAAKRAILEAGHEPLALDGAALPDRPDVGSLRHVQHCDALLLILGVLYGSRPSSDSPSYTHLEFLEAVASEKAIFTFNADPRAHSVSAELLTKYGPELPAQLLAADQLRSAAGALGAPQTFTTPDDLANRVRNTLRLHYGALSPRPSAPAAGAIAPELLPKLCDRRDQLTVFQRHFRPLATEPMNVPLIYLLPGTDDQAHESCVRALVWHEVQKEKEGVDPSYLPPRDRFVGWPAPLKSDPLRTAFGRLLWNLHVAVDRDYSSSEATAESFCALARTAKVPYLVLRHPVHQLDDRGRALLTKYYLPFWNQVAREVARRASAGPRILVFIEVRCPRAPDDRAAAVLEASLKRTLRPYIRKKGGGSVKNALTALGRARGSAPRCAAEVLPWLPDVDAGAFSDWLTRYERWLPTEVIAIDFSEEFAGPAVPMKVFELRMKALLSTRTSA
jgi:hypothetical protein